MWGSVRHILDESCTDESVDLADISIEQARGRFQEMQARSRTGKGDGFFAEFFAMDCFEVSRLVFCFGPRADEGCSNLYRTCCSHDILNARSTW